MNSNLDETIRIKYSTRLNAAHDRISSGNRENPGENGQQNFQKQFASNENQTQRNGNWNNKIQDNPNWLKQGTQLQNASAKGNLMHLNCYNCKEPGHIKREYPYLTHN